MKINYKNIFKYLLVILYPLMISVLLEYNILSKFHWNNDILNNKAKYLII